MRSLGSTVSLGLCAIALGILWGTSSASTPSPGPEDVAIAAQEQGASLERELQERDCLRRGARWEVMDRTDDPRGIASVFSTRKAGVRLVIGTEVATPSDQELACLGEAVNAAGLSQSVVPVTDMGGRLRSSGSDGVLTVADPVPVLAKSAQQQAQQWKEKVAAAAAQDGAQQASQGLQEASIQVIESGTRPIYRLDMGGDAERPARNEAIRYLQAVPSWERTPMDVEIAWEGGATEISW